jgi:hypothetical protein
LAYNANRRTAAKVGELPWKSANFRGNRRTSAEIGELPWKSANFRGNRRTSAEIGELPWNRRTAVNIDRWDAVENELKATLSGVSGANLIRRQKIAIIAAQAYGIGKQLARVPQNADLLPHVQR